MSKLFHEDLSIEALQEKLACVRKQNSTLISLLMILGAFAVIVSTVALIMKFFRKCKGDCCCENDWYDEDFDENDVLAEDSDFVE